MTLRLVATLVAVVGFCVASPAQATDDWLAKAFRGSEAEVTPKKRSASKAKAGTTAKAKPAVTETRTAASKPKTIRAARTDDAKPSLARRSAAPVTAGRYESGVASYYWQPQPVASGGRFNPEAMTAAHKSLPFGTRVRVTRVDNGRSVEVTINDRGPYIAGRIIDLSRRAARDIGMTDIGITRVNVAILGR